MGTATLTRLPNTNRRTRTSTFLITVDTTDGAVADGEESTWRDFTVHTADTASFFFAAPDDGPLAFLRAYEAGRISRKAFLAEVSSTFDQVDFEEVAESAIEEHEDAEQAKRDAEGRKGRRYRLGPKARARFALEWFADSLVDGSIDPLDPLEPYQPWSLHDGDEPIDVEAPDNDPCVLPLPDWARYDEVASGSPGHGYDEPCIVLGAGKALTDLAEWLKARERSDA